eukprot:CAMPEP_0172635464 /NCGR_PEP_ID=MMETSP1068-20121228/199491_1 /TAXON_ID=35684 /ORGANISM="Pseudopedinella elastica, Strain CCMP716" /LENGTH=494 /DNA_ID=CAMNT_0013447693 /DNA_START=85 /DNA_END=1569 /DNA_ORIENTATION=-
MASIHVFILVLARLNIGSYALPSYLRGITPALPEQTSSGHYLFPHVGGPVQEAPTVSEPPQQLVRKASKKHHRDHRDNVKMSIEDAVGRGIINPEQFRNLMKLGVFVVDPENLPASIQGTKQDLDNPAEVKHANKVKRHHDSAATKHKHDLDPLSKRMSEKGRPMKEGPGPKTPAEEGAEAVVHRCAELLQKKPMAGTLKRGKDGVLAFEREPVESIHVFYRFSGSSRHDLADAGAGTAGHSRISRTPSLGAVSVASALLASNQALRASLSWHVFLNGAAAEDRAYGKWFTAMGRDLELRNLTVTPVSPGNYESFREMAKTVAARTAGGREMVILLEEDYWVHPTVFTALTELWAAYSPCMAVPYDYIDRYTSDGGERWAGGREALLVTPGQHWRTVTTSTVTYAVRGDVFRALEALDTLPEPWSDYPHSIRASALVGIWAPVPGLAAHVHPSNPFMTPPIYNYTAYGQLLGKTAMSLRFPYALKLADQHAGPG